MSEKNLNILTRSDRRSDEQSRNRLSEKSEKINALVKEQVDVIKESQEKLQNIVENIELSEEEIDLSTVESVQDVAKKSDDLIVLVQVIIKVRNELGHARLDLEKAKKAKKMVNEAKARLEWLEKRLEKLLIECNEKTSHLLKSTTPTVRSLASPLANTYLSTHRKDRRFSSVQRQRLFADVGGYCERPKQECMNSYNAARSVMNRSQKLLREGARDKNCSLDRDESRCSIQTHDQDGAKDTNDNAFGSEQSLEELPSIDHSRVLLNDPGRTSNLQGRDGDDDKVDEYWESDHHKFEWPNVKQKTSLSWHSLGLPVQDSFLAKDKPVFAASLPWREKATQVNSVIDIHKIALDKLYARLHQLYDVIEKATESSINPEQRNDNIETRKRNAESTKRVPRIASKTTILDGDDDTKDVEERLPQIDVKAVTKQHTAGRRSTKTADLTFPRNSSVWCASNARIEGRVVKKIKTKPPTLQTKTQAILAKKWLENNEASKKQKEQQEKLIWKPSIIFKMVKATKELKIFQAQLQHWDVIRRNEQKWKRIQWLLGPNGLCSPTKEIVIASLKTLGKLRCKHDEVGNAIEQVLQQSKDPTILYEASKAMILSGHWNYTAIDVFQNALKFGSNVLKHEVLDVLRSVEDIPFFDQKSGPFRDVIAALEELVEGDEASLAFSSALCLGQLAVVNPVAKRYLLQIINTNSLNSTQKCQAIDVLVRQMNSKDQILVESLLHELNTSTNWKVRVQACDLLQFIGNRHVFAKDVDEIFEILERLLWDNAHQEVRCKVAELLHALRLRKRACNLVYRRLDDPEETVRARAIISMTTLEMKGEKELKSLLDILALDSSIYARVQAVRAFSKLKWNDPRIVRNLKEREKGEGILAREARKALSQLS